MIVRSSCRYALKTLFAARFCLNKPPPGTFVDIIEKRFNGRLVIIPTPIGNMQDISVNIYQKLFEVDVIGCQDTRVAGKLFKLIESRKIADQLYNIFGYNRGEIAEQDPLKALKEELSDREKLYVQYSRMTQKQRRKLLLKMSLDEQKEFKKDYLVYRATKLLDHFDDFSGKKDKDESMYGLENPDLNEIERYIRDTRKKKGRGVLLPLNTHSETKMFDTILRVLENYNVGLIADAGTPCISDPGFRLIRHLRERAPQIVIQAVKGPSSVGVMMTAAAVTRRQGFVLSGYFEGFSKLLYSSMPQIDYSSFAIYFENAKRLPKTLAYIERLYGPQQPIYIAGEVSKKYERRYHGRVDELRNYLGLPATSMPKQKLAGEVSFFIYPKTNNQPESPLEKVDYEVDPTAVATILNEQIEASSKQLAAILTHILKISKNQATKHIITARKPAKKQSTQKN